MAIDQNVIKCRLCARQLAIFSLIATVIGAGLSFARIVEADESKTRPNIILMMTDDQGYGDLSLHGNPVVKTPHLDQLGQRSVRFEQFHVSPTCAPTRASIMTSRHEFSSGVTHTILERERLSLKATILPQFLKRAGYTTGIFGKWHLGDEDAYQPGKRGFDEVYIHGGGGIGQSYPGSCGDAPLNKYFNPVIRHNGKFVATNGYCTKVFVDQAITWISSQPVNQPFFCYITPNAPHAPLDCPKEYYEPYLEHVPEDVARFYGMITHWDDQLGRLLKALEDRDISKDTIVIFMTDNGSATGAKHFSAGMRANKGTPYEGGIRVPAFWSWAGHWQPQVRQEVTCHYDILPTLTELANVPVADDEKQSWQGRSLVPLLAGQSPAWPQRELITHVGRWPKEHDPKREPSTYQYAKCAIRLEDWKLISNVKQGEPQWELYQLAEDPAEKNNLAKKYPDRVEELKKIYDAWWLSVVPKMENEGIEGPAVNPFHKAYWEQYQNSGPNHANPPDGSPRPAQKRKSSS